MPFVKGRYVPESEMQPAAENEQEQNKPAVREKKRAKGKRFGKKEAPTPELTPEELEAQRLEEERKIKESAERFERLISTDTPDLTQLNLLIEKEKKKEKSAWRKRAGSVKIMLTVLLLASLGLMIMAISFASATLMVISLASMAVLCAAYFLTVPRR